MNYTENLNLNKPEPAEQFNLDHWNGNMDIIDNAVQDEIDTRTSQIQTLTDDLSAEVNTRENAIIDAKNLDNATGILSVQKGGTGMATAQNALENLCSAIPTPESISATDDFIFKRDNTVKKMNLNTIANKIYGLIKVKIVNEAVPSIMDYLNVSTTSFPNTSVFQYIFTATEDCFISISQAWSGDALVGRNVTIKTLSDVYLRRVFYAGYGASPAIYTDPLFLRTGQQVVCEFSGYDAAVSNPKLHVYRKS